MTTETPDAAGIKGSSRPECSWTDLQGRLWKPFRGPSVRGRVLVGIALALVPVLGWCADAGYDPRVLRQTLRGGVKPLPAWTDIPELLLDGLRAMILGLLSLIPSLVLVLLGPATFALAIRAAFSFGSAAYIILVLGMLLALLFLMAGVAVALLMPCVVLQFDAGGMREALAVGRHLRQIRCHWRAYGRLLAFLFLVGISLQLLFSVLPGGAPPVVPGELPPLEELLPPTPAVLAMAPLVFCAGVVTSSAIGLFGRRTGVSPGRNRGPGGLTGGEVRRLA